jgi:hypothetical protein
MNKTLEIETTLPALSTEDLHHIEIAIHGIYRHRQERIIYDDAYGVWLEDDQVSAAADVCRLLDEQEDGHASTGPR